MPRPLLPLLALALLLSAGPAPVRAQPPAPDAALIAVHVSRVGKVGRYLALEAKTKGEVVLWKALDPGIDFLDPVLAPKDTRITGVIADAPGTYRMLAVTSVDNKPALCEFTVTFDGPRPVPVPPGPAPGPAPKPPAPTDALLKKLQAAYDSDTGTPAVKRAQMELLVGLCEAMTVHARKDAVKTTAQLLADYKAAAYGNPDKKEPGLILPNALVEVRKVIAAEALAALGPEPAPLDGALRARAVDLYDRLALTLRAVRV